MEPTFLRQLAEHKKLHAVEFILSTLMFGFFCGLPTLFQYTYVTFSVAAVMGLLTVLYFVTQEYSCAQRIFRIQQNPAVGCSRKIQLDGQNYGWYSSLQVKQAELSVLTSYFYIVRLFFSNFWWALGKLLQFAGIVAIVVLVLAMHEWFAHPVLVHSYIIDWFYTGRVHRLDLLLRAWSSIGMLIAVVFLWPSAFAANGQSNGDRLRDSKVAKILIENRRGKRYGLVYQEKLAVKLRYSPDTLDQWELDNLSEQDAAILQQYHPDVLIKAKADH